jgi:hypothetical protein
VDYSKCGWIVSALEIVRDSPVIRRMYYAAVAVAIVYAIAPVLVALIERM